MQLCLMSMEFRDTPVSAARGEFEERVKYNLMMIKCKLQKVIRYLMKATQSD